MDKENILQEAGLTEEDIVINPYNPFDYLQTQEEIDEYLQDAFMDDNPEEFIVALGYLARKRGMSKVARLAGVNRESLYRSLSEGGNPGYATVVKVTRALGCKLTVERQTEV